MKAKSVATEASPHSRSGKLRGVTLGTYDAVAAFVQNGGGMSADPFYTAGPPELVFEGRARHLLVSDNRS
jgi:hypothetical protein